MNKQLTFGFIGGDQRQLCTVSQLADNGYHIRTFGFDKEEPEPKSNIYKAQSPTDCVSGADAVVLPVPYTIDKVCVNMPLSDRKASIEEVVNSAELTATIFAGKADYMLEDMCGAKGIKIIDYASREELAVMNSIPTAEGAIEIAMANTPYTLHGSRCLVIGYGRIGKILSASLKGLGAEVTATARKYSDLAWIEANKIQAVNTARIGETAGEYDVIFNTVPHMVLDFKVLSRTKKDVLIIDLASRPGGVDFNVAKELNRKVIWALSLPGKVAPKTAGEIIKNTLLNILEE